MNVELVSLTKGVGRFEKYTTEELIAVLARVSNEANEGNVKTAPKLLRYLMREKHWSPFEMVNACVQINAPRDVVRQILRHRSFSFQEFSGRYAEYGDPVESREGRAIHPTNRQSSLPLDLGNTNWWDSGSKNIRDAAWAFYKQAIDRGVAKEVARSVLPEGFVQTNLYMTGSLRSWIHYWQVRCHESTQKEHREVAEATKASIMEHFPNVREALNTD